MPPDALARLGKGAIHTVAFSADSRSLAVGDGVGLTLYDALTLGETWLVPGSGAVISLALSPNGRYVAAGQENGSLILLNAHGGEIIQTVPGNAGDNGIQSLAWQPQASEEGGRSVVAAGFNDGIVRLFSLEEAGEEPHVTALGMLERQSSGVTSLAFAPDGRVLASGNRSGIVNLWDIQSLEQLAALRQHEASHAILTLAWSPGGNTLASGGRDEQVIIWDVASRTSQVVFSEHEAEVLDVAFIPGTDNVLTTAADGATILWRAHTGTILEEQGIDRQAVSAALSPDGATHAVAAGDGTLIIRPFQDVGESEDRLPQTLTGHVTPGRRVTGLAWAPDGRRLASSMGADVVVWDAPANEALRVFAGHDAAVGSVAWEGAGGRLATGDRRGTVLIWDSDTGEQLAAMSGHTHEVASLSWSPDGTRLASAGSLDDSVVIWDADNGQALHTLQGDGSGLWSVAWSPDGTTLAAGTTRGEVRLWDVSGSGAPQPVNSLGRHFNWVADMVWSPDGARLATAGADNRIVLWEIATGEALVLSGHSSVVRGVAFSPDGSRLASASRDGQVIVWDVGPGAESTPLRRLIGHTEGVNAVAWSPAGYTFASGSDDGTVLLWE